MKAFILAVVLPLLAQAANPRNLPVLNSKYKCLTLQHWEDINLPCARNCEELGLRGADGCHKNDFVCHCKRYSKVEELLSPCFLTPGGVNATCTGPELGAFAASVTDVCKYFNATGYASYLTCPLVLLE